MINARVHVRHVVSKSIKKNQRVSIVTSRNDPNIKSVKKIPYLNFTEQINNTFEELENEIMSQVESCVYDYHDEYVSLLTTSPEGHETIHVIYEPEI
jgi:hypothetical protein